MAQQLEGGVTYSRTLSDSCFGFDFDFGSITASDEYKLLVADLRKELLEECSELDVARQSVNAEIKLQEELRVRRLYEQMAEIGRAHV